MSSIGKSVMRKILDSLLGAVIFTTIALSIYVFPIYSAIIYLSIAFCIVGRKVGMMEASVFTLYPLIIVFIDNFVDGNQTQFRQVAYAIYAVLVIILIIREWFHFENKE